MGIKINRLGTQAIPKRQRKTRLERERWNSTSVRNAVDEEGRRFWLQEDGSRGAPPQSESDLILDLELDS